MHFRSPTAVWQKAEEVALFVWLRVRWATALCIINNIAAVSALHIEQRRLRFDDWQRRAASLRAVLFSSRWTNWRKNSLIGPPWNFVGLIFRKIFPSYLMKANPTSRLSRVEQYQWGHKPFKSVASLQAKEPHLSKFRMYPTSSKFEQGIYFVTRHFVRATRHIRP